MSVDASVEFAGLRAARAAVPGAAQPGADRAQVRRAAEEFESVFLAQFLGAMWEGIEVDETFGGGAGEQVFRGMLLNEYARGMARAGGLGIADHLEREMLRLQEVKQ
jgi:Rod binding domain-containing protein